MPIEGIPIPLAITEMRFPDRRRYTPECPNVIHENRMLQKCFRNKSGPKDRPALKMFWQNRLLLLRCVGWEFDWWTLSDASLLLFTLTGCECTDDRAEPMREAPSAKKRCACSSVRIAGRGEHQNIKMHRQFGEHALGNGCCASSTSASFLAAQL